MMIKILKIFKVPLKWWNCLARYVELVLAYFQETRILATWVSKRQFIMALTFLIRPVAYFRRIGIGGCSLNHIMISFESETLVMSARANCLFCCDDSENFKGWRQIRRHWIKLINFIVLVRFIFVAFNVFVFQSFNICKQYSISFRHTIRRVKESKHNFN